MTQDDLAVVLELHERWLSGDPEGQRANIANKSLVGLSLANANLSRAILAGTGFYQVDLSGANLSQAMLVHANFHSACIHNVNLSEAHLRGASFTKADLRGANLKDSYLYHVSFREAVLPELDIPTIPRIDAVILLELMNGGVLDWNSEADAWDAWVIKVGGEKAAALAKVVGTLPAATLIYAVSRPDQDTPSFYASNSLAIHDMETSITRAMGWPATPLSWLKSSWDHGPSCQCLKCYGLTIMRRAAEEYGDPKKLVKRYLEEG